MPHDAKGNELKVGDKVMIPGTVLAVSPGITYCNCEVELDIPMPPYTNKMVFQGLNTQQVVKV